MHDHDHGHGDPPWYHKLMFALFIAIIIIAVVGYLRSK
jgi:hypothetical protein